MQLKLATLWSVLTASGAKVTLFYNNDTKARVLVRFQRNVPEAYAVAPHEVIPEPRVGSHIDTLAYKSRRVVQVLSN
jgi:hypothetical protein